MYKTKCDDEIFVKIFSKIAIYEIAFDISKMAGTTDKYKNIFDLSNEELRKNLIKDLKQIGDNELLEIKEKMPEYLDVNGIKNVYEEAIKVLTSQKEENASYECEYCILQSIIDSNCFNIGDEYKEIVDDKYIEYLQEKICLYFGYSIGLNGKEIDELKTFVSDIYKDFYKTQLEFYKSIGDEIDENRILDIKESAYNNVFDYFSYDEFIEAGIENIEIIEFEQEKLEELYKEKITPEEFRQYLDYDR